MDTRILLDKINIFNDLNSREKDLLSIVFIPRKIEAGKVFFNQGDPAPGFFIVVSGSLSGEKKIKTGHKVKLRTYFQNDFIGMLSMFSKAGKRGQTVTAVDEAIVLECSRDHFNRLFDSQKLFSYKMIDTFVTYLSQNLRQVNQQMANLFSNPKQTMLKITESMYLLH